MLVQHTCWSHLAMCPHEADWIMWFDSPLRRICKCRGRQGILSSCWLPCLVLLELARRGIPFKFGNSSFSPMLTLASTFLWSAFVIMVAWRLFCQHPANWWALDYIDIAGGRRSVSCNAAGTWDFVNCPRSLLGENACSASAILTFTIVYRNQPFRGNPFFVKSEWAISEMSDRDLMGVIPKSLKFAIWFWSDTKRFPMRKCYHKRSNCH